MPFTRHTQQKNALVPDLGRERLFSTPVVPPTLGSQAAPLSDHRRPLGTTRNLSPLTEATPDQATAIRPTNSLAHSLAALTSAFQPVGRLSRFRQASYSSSSTLLRYLLIQLKSSMASKPCQPASRRGVSVKFVDRFWPSGEFLHFTQCPSGRILQEVQLLAEVELLRMQELCLCGVEFHSITKRDAHPLRNSFGRASDSLIRSGGRQLSSWVRRPISP